MYTTVLLAALTNQIVFDVQYQGSIWTVVPQIMLTRNCDCQIQLAVARTGASGNSNTRQRSRAHIKGNHPYSVSRLSVNVEAGDSLIIHVSVTDGKTVNLTQQWSLPGLLSL